IKYIFVGRDGLDVFMSLWHHWNNMRPESIDEINATPGRVGDPLPLPPTNMHTAFDAWLDRGGFPWEQDGYPFWSHLAHAQSWWDYRHLENILFVHFNVSPQKCGAESPCPDGLSRRRNVGIIARGMPPSLSWSQRRYACRS